MKVCSKCKTEKAIGNFYKDKRSRDGLRSQCRECEKEYKMRYEEIHKADLLILRRKINEKYRKTHKEIERLRQKRYRENNPDKVKARKEKYKLKNPGYSKLEYNRRLERLGKTRRPILTEEEKEIKRLKQKEQTKRRAYEHYIKNFVSVEKICKYCGTPFMTQYKKSKVFCSEECSRKSERYLQKIADKRRQGKITAKDRLDNDITLPLLFKRDKGICKICGLPCSWSDKVYLNGVIVVGNNYPSIDHVKAIAKGGTHTWDNVQLAHKLCNSIKGDKETT